jgi:hypothetical protein
MKVGKTAAPVLSAIAMGLYGVYAGRPKINKNAVYACIHIRQDTNQFISFQTTQNVTGRAIPINGGITGGFPPTMN